jgi:hypothetical protein
MGTCQLVAEAPSPVEAGEGEVLRDGLVINYQGSDHTSQRAKQRFGEPPQIGVQTVPAGQLAVVVHGGAAIHTAPELGTRQTGSPPSSSLQEQVFIAHCPSSVHVLPQLPLARQVSPEPH